MRILLINNVYKIGSTGKIVDILHKSLLTEGHNSLLCFGRGPHNKGERTLIKISSQLEIYFHIFLTRITGFQGIFSFFATRKLLRIIENFKPDIVHLFILHGYYVNEFKLLNYLRTKHIYTIYSMLDEYPYMGKCCYPFECEKFKTVCDHCPQNRSYPKSLYFDRSSSIYKMKKQAYRNFDTIIFTGPKWVIDRAKESSLIGKMNFAVIDEFTDVENVFYPRDSTGLRSKLGISERAKIVLNVARFTDPRKGCVYYLEIARLLEKENIVFIHVGYDIKVKNLPINFIPINYVANQDLLAEYYSLADLLACTSLADTMPNVCLEALSCGTPVCGFDTAGTPYVTTYEFGKFTPVNDINSLASVIQTSPLKTEEISQGSRKYAKDRYSKHLFLSKVLNLYSKRG